MFGMRGVDGKGAYVGGCIEIFMVLENLNQKLRLWMNNELLRYPKS